jgi:hypothetical protein
MRDGNAVDSTLVVEGRRRVDDSNRGLGSGSLMPLGTAGLHSYSEGFVATTAIWIACTV